jgi:Helix-turn-helix domain
MPALTKQQRKVANYIWQHPGCTTKDIQRDTGITCPSGRITEIRQAGIVIRSIGQKRYPGSKAFECYVIELPTPTTSNRLIAKPAPKQLSLV